MIRKSAISLLAIVAMLAFAAVVSQAHPQSLLTHHVSAATLTGQAPSIGRLPATQTMRIDVVLPLRDPSGLEVFLQQVYDPSSVFYRHFVTPQEFADRFGPTQDQYNAVIAFAKENGFTVMGGSREGEDVQLQGTVRSIESAFHVTMGVYQHPTENRTFYAPDREPSVDLPFPLWHISGLDNYSRPRPLYKKRTAPGTTTTKGSCPGNAFCGSDMRAAYYQGSALDGTGQTVGLLEYAGFNITDVNTYYTNAGQTRTAAVTGISTDGTNVTCNYPQCDDTEQTLDITQALGMAPGISTLYVYVGSSDSAILSSMATHSPLSSNLSSSWSWSPGDPLTDNPYFQQFAAQGQNFFQASGDSGKWTSSTQFVWPGDAAYVTTVGGTDLVVTSKGGPWSSETAWSDGGGGFYTPDSIPIPAWQQLTGVITSSNHGSTTLRNGPDVAAESNFDFYVCANQGKAGGCTSNSYGGTSFAAPMWAGYMALVNQQALLNGNPPLGFINPIIYPLALGTGYATLFHDITSGSNGWAAVVGYDLATGWGSPNTDGLINALAGTSSGDFGISVSPNSITVAKGSSGRAVITTTISGSFNSAVTLTATGQASGVNILFHPKVIAAPGAGTSTIEVKVGGTRVKTQTITITGTAGSVSHSTTLTLNVTN